MSEILDSNRERELKRTDEPVASPAANEDKAAMGVLENALAACEDDQDVQAARTAKAEAVADLAEFDENIPLEDQEKEKEPEISKAEQEVENLVKQVCLVGFLSLSYSSCMQAEQWPPFQRAKIIVNVTIVQLILSEQVLKIDLIFLTNI